jgi:hypothetical protein
MSVMRSGFLAAIYVLLLAAAGCVDRYKPPTPHISGPDSAYVGDTVVFTATYKRDMPEGDAIWPGWSWGDGDSTYLWWGDAYYSWHVYRRTGTFTVTLVLTCVTHFGDMTGFHSSDRSNACTIHILDSP